MEKDNWLKIWQEGFIPGGAESYHRELPALVEVARSLGMLARGSRIYIPGCGHGNNAAALSDMGFDVVAEDVVPQAISEARKRYHSKPIQFRLGDVLQVVSADKAAFDGVFDLAMLCTLSPCERNSYVQACRERLQPNGVFMSCVYTMIDHGTFGQGPPYFMDVSAYQKLLQDGFTLMDGWENHHPPGNSIIEREYCCIWRRRDDT